MTDDARTTPGQETLESGLVRVRGFDKVMGAGFLIAPDVVCTCAHVVADALGVPRTLDVAPDGPVDIDFPLLRDEEGAVPARRATVVSWKRIEDDDSGDVALLRLEHPVAAARTVPLVDGTSAWGNTFRAYGFPHGADQGVWVSGMLRATQGAGWLQMDAAPGAKRIEPGYSGAPVWDDVQGGVIGMTVAAGRGRLDDTAYLVPSAALVDEEVLRPRCPFRGLTPFGEEDADIFHGRDDDTERLLKAVAMRKLTVLAGPSGCGKSSLIRAGLLPAVRQAGMTVSVLRPVPGVPPEAALAQAVVPVLEPQAGGIERLRKADELAGLLRKGLRDGQLEGTVAALGAALRTHGGSGGHLLFVDQLEEYTSAEPAAARTLFTLLAAVAESDTGTAGAAGRPDMGIPAGDAGTGGRVRVVVTGRADSLDVLITPETSDVVSDAVLFLAPLGHNGLLHAVTGPVAAVPGLWLEPGLPERIVEDAGDAPGRMPLVEFALTRLWERREGSMLTHAAYRELGGIAGALVGYAEDFFRAQVPLSEEAVAKRLFVQLARPDGRGGFTRRATPLADLDAATVALARRLAPGKLVLLDRTPQGVEIIDLAHEALTRLWPTLKEWLEDSREFRDWQEQLRRDITRWETGKRETGGLLRGKMLADAHDWLKRRPEDIPPSERAYVEAGRRHERRGARRWRAATAGLLALFLLATALAVVAVRNGQDARAKVRTLASRSLADESDNQGEHNPGASLQLALAAWHAEHTPQARKALLKQYVRGQYLRGSYNGLWRGRVQNLQATPDGQVLVVLSKPAGGDQVELSVVTGAATGKPQHYTLRGTPAGDQRGAVSPDGRHYAAGTPDGTVRLWRLDGKSRGPTVLTRGGAAGRVTTGSPLDFSADSSRLLRLLPFQRPLPQDNGHQGVLSVWDVKSGAALTVSREVLPEGELHEVAFAADPRDVVVNWHAAGVTDRYAGAATAVRELATGRTVRKISDGSSANLIWLGGGGAYAVEQREKERTSTVYIRDTATGSATRANGRTMLTEATKGYLQEEAGKNEGANEVLLTRLPTGETYRTRLPADNEPGYSDPELAAVPRAGGGLTVLATVSDTLLIAVALPVTAPVVTEDQTVTTHIAISSDGQRVARVNGGQLEVDSHDGTRSTVTLPRAEGTDRSRWRVMWTKRSGHLVLWLQDGAQVYVYAAGELEDRVSVTLDMGTDTGGRLGTLDAAAALDSDGDDIALLTAGGALLRVDPERGVQTGQALRVDGTPVDPDSPFGVTGRLSARPGHPYQVALVTRNGTRLGEVQLWNVETRKRTGLLSGDKIRSVFRGDDNTSMVYSSDGQELLLQNDDGYVHRWDVAAGVVKGPRIAVDTLDDLIGATGRGTVITKSAEGGFDLWEADTGAPIGSIPEEAGENPTAVIRGDRLFTAVEGVSHSYDLRPTQWFKQLCAAADRDYTKAEKDHLLPPGTPPERPCATEDS